MQRVSNLEDFRIFKRSDASLSKQSVITNWKNNGVFEDVKVQELFSDYYTNSSGNILSENFNAERLEAYLTQNSNWFDEIFSTNFE